MSLAIRLVGKSYLWELCQDTCLINHTPILCSRYYGKLFSYYLTVKPRLWSCLLQIPYAITLAILKATERYSCIVHEFVTVMPCSDYTISIW